METTMTQSIVEIKRKADREEWQQRIQECQNSGLTVRKWCEEHGISTGSYYAQLRKIRERYLEEHQLVSLNNPISSSGEIEITSGNIQVKLPESISTEKLQAVLTALKTC